MHNSSSSRSLRSDESQHTSSSGAHDDQSHFEGALTRRESWTSTTPTSPEVEMSQTHSIGLAEDQQNVPVIKTVVPSSHSPPPVGNGPPERDTMTIVAHVASPESNLRRSSLAAVGILAATTANGEAVEPDRSSVSGDEPGGLPFQLSSASMSNRNKPLPIPIEHMSSSHSSKLVSDTINPGPLIPALSFSPADLPQFSPASSDDPPTFASSPQSHDDSTHHHDGSTHHHDDSNPQKTSLRSMFNRHSKLFRSSTTSRGYNANKILTEPDGQILSKIRRSTGLRSDSSLPRHYLPDPPLPTAPQMRIPFKERSGNSHGRDRNAARSSKDSPPILPFRSQSPFKFRRATSWLGGSKSDYLQERDLKAPISPQASSASSTASHDSSKLNTPDQQQSTISNFLSFKQSRFSQSHVSARHSKEHLTGAVDASTTTNPISAPTLHTPVAVRPRLNRFRSKSMDIMELFRHDPSMVDLQDFTGIKGADSVAVGTTSIVDVEVPEARVAKVTPAREESKTTDKSRLSKLLRRKPSSVTGKETSTPNHTPSGTEKDHRAPLRQADHRVLDLSRSKKLLCDQESVPFLRTKSEKEKRTAEEAVFSRPHNTTQHRRNQSSGGSTAGFVSARSTLTKAERDVLVSINCPLDAKESQREESLLGTKNLKVKAMESRVLEAAQIATYLSEADALAKKEIVFERANVIDELNPMNSKSSGKEQNRGNLLLDKDDGAMSEIKSTAEGQVPSQAVQSNNSGHMRRRTMSFSRLIDPFRTKSRPPSPSKEEEEEEGEDDEEEESGKEDFASASSHTMMMSPPPLASKRTTKTATDATARYTLTNTTHRLMSSSSLEKASSDKIVGMKSSDSVPTSAYNPFTGAASTTQESVRISAKDAPSSSSSSTTRKSSNTSLHGSASAHRMSSSANTKARIPPPSAFHCQPFSHNYDSALSDTEDDPLPPARRSSQGTGSTLKAWSPSISIPHKRAASKSSLLTDTKAIFSPLLFTPIARPSSALGMSADLERGAQRIASGGIGERRLHRPSQATLSIADDLEFLQALEEVRRVHKTRIKKQEEEAMKIQQMAKMGMASGNKRVKAGEAARGRPANLQLAAFAERPLGRSPRITPRSSSADGRLYSYDEAIGARRSRTTSIAPSASRTIEAAEKPSALELGVGKASGKHQDGAFLNDDDWKREVKALFVIRELVLTERSYARYLEALLQAVRAMYPPTAQRQLSTGSLSRTGGNNTTSIPSHIALMRKLLPQLIALSRSLANRIDENPTAAGVEAAFRLVSKQLEATFVAWSSVAQDVMAALRISERSKSKSKDRIGLITLTSLESAITDKGSHQGNQFVSVPNSPTYAVAPMSSSARPALEDRSSANSENSSILSTPQAVPSRIAKRRSTFTGAPPSFSASLRAKTSSDSGRKTEELKLKLPASTPAPSLGRRAIEAVVSSSRQPLLPKGKAQTGFPPEILSRTSTTATPLRSNTPTMGGSHALDAFCSKKLGAMDVAIMPTQRLLRYILLLRDLNVNTPPQSLSHVRLQRNIDFIKKVASSCDRASKGGPSLPSMGR
ncbi:hypothetical protein CBS101457_001855 [Exobasidium rhododendri]|nr:hypothetical protein CBS101457_001855 [Exobasidium rhododendri]